MGHNYMIEARNKKSTYEKEEWHNKLKNGKNIIVEITTFYRWGTFTATLTKNDIKEIENLDRVIINNYDDFELIDMIDGCSAYIEITNENTYTKEELIEIKNLMYCYDGNKYTIEDEEEEPEFDICEFEENGWESYDCEYGIDGGCSITDNY
jgi:hypothetical protein